MTDDVIGAQQAMLRAMYARHVGPGEPYALVDFPDHANVGDSAIWLGETRMLRAVTGRDPDYVATWQDFDADACRAASPNGVLFLHGGGNLGDIWPHHQQCRETALARLRDRRVVQLPQSIHFRAPGGITRFARLVADHPDFHLYVRDRASLDIARRHWACSVDLMPDSALALGRQVRRPPNCDVLILARTDDEQAGHGWDAVADIGDAIRLDWLNDGVLPVRGEGQPLANHYAALASARVERGLALVSRGRRVVTDRLHGHILALLLDIPHVALDNDYGKISGYIDCWTSGSSRVRRARDVGHAAACLAADAG